MNIERAQKILSLAAMLLGIAVLVAIFFLELWIPSFTADSTSPEGESNTLRATIKSLESPAEETLPVDISDSKTSIVSTHQEGGSSTDIPRKSVLTPGPLVLSPPEAIPSLPIDSPVNEPLPTQSVIDVVLPNGALNWSDILTYTNEERAKEGLRPLLYNAQLSTIAEAKALDMIEKQYFAHVSPSGVDVSVMADTYGYAYLNIGENLALGDFESSREVVTGWMNSPGHRENIMNTNYREIGIAALLGTYEGRKVWYAVQEFGRPYSDCPLPDELLKKKIKIYQGQLDALAQTLDSLKREMEDPGISHESYNAKVKDYNTIVELNNSIIVTTKNAILEYNQKVDIYNFCVGAK